MLPARKRISFIHIVLFRHLGTGAGRSAPKHPEDELPRGCLRKEAYVYAPLRRHEKKPLQAGCNGFQNMRRTRRAAYAPSWMRV